MFVEVQSTWQVNVTGQRELILVEKGSPKGDKGKADKGKSKGKFDAGKGKPQIKQLTEGQSPEANPAEGREVRQQQNDPKNLR